MRPELFYKPHVLAERISQELTKRHRVRRLRGTCASSLTPDHIDSLELIELAAKDGARVFHDIGANVGTWTQLCRALVPDSSIVCFEPMEEHFAAFRKNTEQLDRVRLFPVALGAVEETRTFHPASFSDASGFLPLKAGHVREDRLVDVYQDSPLFRDLRNPEKLEGRCGRCEFRQICAGSRSRAFGLTGNAFATDPWCVYEPAQKAELVSA